MSLTLCPTTLREARAFVGDLHRHHEPPTGGLFAVATAAGRRVVAVAIVGRPNARMSQDGYTAEVTRLCIDEAWVDDVATAWAAGATFAASERGLCGLAHAEAVLRALDRCPYRMSATMLYGACWRACKALGYRRLITYTLPEEGGASLRAAGWTTLGERGGGSWSREGRPRVDTHPTQTKIGWEAA